MAATSRWLVMCATPAGSPLMPAMQLWPTALQLSSEAFTPAARSKGNDCSAGVLCDCWWPWQAASHTCRCDVLLSTCLLALPHA